ncbi:uncharacterized protein SETTUDRAFT_18290 [Exserohilum turcica Et28A]|uniref:Uncharacterized protein n=1 Tax=Exserohilum turcicum (strain 28A) TaxID=671987 RepID=R0KFM2_EXST2|nr:uncharacterized protein SETTUDRAFT_18290 [Exserohilum turcica Et28A]EOA91613.1 hypothetical protein SETTUDRAFT_18290 [Exserohilum turcica Et28A]
MEDNEQFEGNTPEAIRILKYYFVLMAALFILAGYAAWSFYRRTARKRELRRQAEEEALARDMQAWSHPRIFMHGRYAASHMPFVLQEEGLDRNGEAPPPYRAKLEEAPALYITIPLPTLSRTRGRRSQPPQYHVCIGDTTASERQGVERSGKDHGGKA